MKRPSRMICATVVALYLSTIAAVAEPTAPAAGEAATLAAALQRFQGAPARARTPEAAEALAAWIYAGNGALSYEERMRVLATEMEDPAARTALAPVANALEGRWEEDAPGALGSAYMQRTADLGTQIATGALWGGGLVGVAALVALALGVSAAVALPVVAVGAGLGALIGLFVGAGDVLDDWGDYRDETHPKVHPAQLVPVHQARAEAALATASAHGATEGRVRDVRAPRDLETACGREASAVPSMDCLEVQASVP